MNRQELKELANNNIFYKDPLDDIFFDLLEDIMNETLEANQKFNLTAIKEDEDFRELMIYDSILPLKYISFNKEDNIIDVGTGAGFPGIPMAICSRRTFTLLDSTKKKIDYINSVASKYHLETICGIAERVEDFANEYREEYDHAVARAVAPLNILVELVLPLVKVGGTFIAMKGSNGKEELKKANSAIEKLGGKIKAIHEDILPIPREPKGMNL